MEQKDKHKVKMQERGIEASLKMSVFRFMEVQEQQIVIKKKNEHSVKE